MRALASPRVTVSPDARAVGDAVAARVASALRETPRLVLGLPTGRTPIPMYQALVALAARGQADFSRATTFNLDEFLGLTPDHASSFRAFMNRHFFDRVNLAPSRINFLDGTPADAEAECDRYERAIEEAGGIDLLLLGLGTNGHIGFNEPGAVLVARTHRVRLTPETRAANAALFDGDEGAVPAEALSMGMATILQARSAVLLAHGESKAGCIARVVNGPLTTELPASFLQLHHDADLILDAAAAGQLAH